jgi:prevent-host-death family protein
MMNSVNLKEARKHLGNLVDKAERGTSVTITRRGRKVARLVPMEKESHQSLPDLALFRASIKVKGGSLTDALLSMRLEERI